MEKLSSTFKNHWQGAKIIVENLIRPGFSRASVVIEIAIVADVLAHLPLSATRNIVGKFTSLAAKSAVKITAPVKMELRAIA